MLTAGASDHSPMRLAKAWSVNLFSRRSFMALILSLCVEIRRDFGQSFSPRVRTLICGAKSRPCIHLLHGGWKC